jgi:hypothetical protein
MPSVVNGTVFPLSTATGAPVVSANAGGKPWDVAVGGRLFMLATSEEFPLVRQSSPIRKEQQDTEPEPGEQSLTGWWIRSQENFSKGAGVLYQESRVEIEPSDRFRTSMGVDVWTPGRVSLLKTVRTLQDSVEGTTHLAAGMDGTTPVVFQASGSTLYRITEAGVTSVSWGGTGTIIDVEVIDDLYYVIDNVGVWTGTVGGSAGTKIWNVTSASFAAYRRVGGFTILLVDNKAYDLTGSAGPALPAAFFTHAQGASFRWSAAAIGTGDLRVAGYSAGETSIWTFTPTLSSSGWTFTHSTGLPRGEKIHALEDYYHTYLVMGTSKGVRFAAYQDAGQYTFGPLSWSKDGAGPVRGVRVIDRFVYAAAENGLEDGTSGLVRIDPETEISEGRFAWANDLQAGATGQMGDVVDLNSRPVFALYDDGTIIEHATDLEETGYLTTGRVRYRTLENKVFKYVRLRTDALVGTISVTAVTDNDSDSTVVTYSEAGATDHEEAAISSALGAVESLAFRFTLARATATTGPTMRSYQLKALPAPKRQRIFRLPLSCYDKERAYNGQEMGYRGRALEVLGALEAFEEAGDLIVYQDLRGGTSRLCIIDEIQFRQTSPPGDSSLGGLLYLTLRAVD